MNWGIFNTYDLGHRAAFETLNNQLFERYVRRNYASTLRSFRVVNGSGGDGGIEAYAELLNSDIIAVQSKWFLQALGKGELNQIRNSIVTAKKVRPQLREYIICIPHDVNSVRIGKGKKLTKNDEENRINELVDEMFVLYPDLKLTWWFDNELLGELQQPDNEGVHKYWFEKEVISLPQVKQQFVLKKQHAWLKERYVPDLNGLGVINKEYKKLVFSKNFRGEISEEITECINKLQHGIVLVKQFLKTNEFSEKIKAGLEDILQNLKTFINAFINLQFAAETGNNYFKADEIKEADIWTVLLVLEKISPTQIQKVIWKKLIAALRDIHRYHLPNYLLQLNEQFNQYVKFFYGRAGTGKTQGMAFTAETHLNNGMPAIIIQAKNSPNNSWTSILSEALDISGWSTNEILSALETLALRNDNLIAAFNKPGTNTNCEESTAVICVDGIEEAIGHEVDWASRVRESIMLSEKFPRVRFLFTARNYYEGGLEDLSHRLYESISLPYEGDVSVSEVAEGYLKHYDVKIESLSVIKGIDSLLALKLFCEQYSGKTLKESEDIITATRELLKNKVDRINKEYIASLAERKGMTQEPVKAALFAIAKYFYTESEIEHNTLRTLILSQTKQILNGSEIDIMIDHFAQNGILSRDSRVDEESVLGETSNFYRITYQSITEHILSEQIYHDIKKDKLKEIPDILHTGMITPVEELAKRDLFAPPLNQKIIQSIVSRLFIETGELIGENQFLSKGFSDEMVLELKLGALYDAPYELAIKYKELVDGLFNGGPALQFKVLNELIVPSCSHAETAFGTEYLHDKLISFPTAFERDKVWSGIDSYEDNSEEGKEYNNNVKELIDITGTGTVILLGTERSNEKPLLYAWALSNVDQVVRNALRIALTGWAVKNPTEFIRLLDKVFFCNDPQIQEDLAAVALGVATHLTDATALAALSEWAVRSIFSQKKIFRNVVVRQGFRAIVEKAGLLSAAKPGEIMMARPTTRPDIEMIDLDVPALTTGGSEIYPITHDLAWYVIDNAYEDFLEIPVAAKGGSQDQDCPEAKALLDLYRDKYQLPEVFAHSWTMAAAISYIKNVLGLTRNDGNGWTSESHGGKSKVYTYEEKYTWLAVHYLQGYLSDYVPIKENYSDRVWVEDYTKLTEIPNPGEQAASLYPQKAPIKNQEWIIKEELAPTLDLTGDIDKNIKAWVNEKPKIDFGKWIYFDGKDFPEYGKEKKWLALLNDTFLSESSNAGVTNLKIRAVIIQEADFQQLHTTLGNKLQRSHVARHLDRLYSSPDTGTYSNPADLVWMKWIGETEPSSEFHNISGLTQLNHTIVKLVQETVHGEKYYRLPSKMVRELLNIQSYTDDILKDGDDNITSFIHKKSDGSHRDSQEIVLADHKLLEELLRKKGLRIIWLCDFFKKKNPLNESLKENIYDQRTTKYLVWEANGILNHLEFWNAYFSDTTDEEKNIKR